MSEDKEEEEKKVPSNVIQLFGGWDCVFDSDMLELREKDIRTLLLPSGVKVEALRGFYGNIPVEVARGESLGTLVFIRAAGANRQNRKANQAKLKEKLKYVRVNTQTGEAK